MVVTQESINEIFAYLHSFKDGTRTHHQGSIHTAIATGCGTSHCLAGWKAHDDYVKTIGEEPTYCDNFSHELDSFIEAYKEQVPESDQQKFFMEWEYAQYKWGLSTIEADLLFVGELTLDEMFVNAAQIAEAHGLWVPA